MNSAYVAGLFDGKGSIRIYSKGANCGRKLQVHLVQRKSASSTDLVDSLASRWGGHVVDTHQGSAWNWTLSGNAALNFLQDIRPSLVSKAGQADLAIDWQSSRALRPVDADGRFGPYPPAMRAYDDRVAQQLKGMQGRG